MKTVCSTPVRYSQTQIFMMYVCSATYSHNQCQILPWWLLRAAGPNFIELLSTKMCSAWNFFHNKSGLCTVPTKFPSNFQDYNIWIPVSSNMQLMEIWLVILFLSRKKFHAQQICVLSSSIKLGPGDRWHCTNSLWIELTQIKWKDL